MYSISMMVDWFKDFVFFLLQVNISGNLHTLSSKCANGGMSIYRANLIQQLQSCNVQRGYRFLCIDYFTVLGQFNICLDYVSQ